MHTGDAARWSLDELRSFLAKPLLAAKTLTRATLEVDNDVDTDVHVTRSNTTPIAAAAPPEISAGAAYGFVLIAAGRDTGRCSRTARRHLDVNAKVFLYDQGNWSLRGPFRLRSMNDKTVLLDPWGRRYKEVRGKEVPPCRERSLNRAALGTFEAVLDGNITGDEARRALMEALKLPEPAGVKR